MCIKWTGTYSLVCRVPFGASGLEMTKPSDGNDETNSTSGFKSCRGLSWQISATELVYI